MDQLFDEDLLRRNRRQALSGRHGDAQFLLQRVGEELAERLSVVERRFDRALEVNGATGLAGALALATGKIGQLDRIDLAAPHAALAEGSGPTGLDRLDAGTDLYRLVLAPLFLHVTNDLPGMLVQIRRALQPDGLFLAAIPGAGTLAELRDVLLSAEAELYGGAHPRVIPFADVRDIGGLLQRAGFALPVVDVDTVTVRYASLFSLLRDLRAMGMANPLIGRSRRPVSRRLFLRAAELYAERHADPDGRIRASFSIVYVSGWSPHESQQKPLKPGSAKMRLADALRPPGDGPASSESGEL